MSFTVKSKCLDEGKKAKVKDKVQGRRKDFRLSSVKRNVDSYWPVDEEC